MTTRAAAVTVLGLLGAFWAMVLVAAALTPEYAHGRDYVSSLAARGAEHASLGVLAIVAAGLAAVAAAPLVRPISGTAALALAASGVGFVVAAFARVSCPSGAARCGLGGRLDLHGSHAVTHGVAVTTSTVLLVAAIAWIGVRLLGVGRRAAGAASLATAVAIAGAFTLTGGDSPGGIQRVGILLMTGWLGAAAVTALARRTPAG